MKNTLLASSVTALALLLCLPANAADAIIDTVYEPVPIPVVQDSSNQFCDAYVGVQAGYVWGDIEHAGLMASSASPEFLSEGKADGVSGGLYAGCNFRQDSFLWGVEGDINLLGTGAGDHQDWYGTLRLRGGPTLGNTLVYATGGLAFGSLDMISNNFPSQDNYIIDTPVSAGFTVGVGAEHWFSDKVSWKTEYLYLDMGKVTTMESIYDPGVEQMRADYKAHTVRTGISVHF